MLNRSHNLAGLYVTGKGFVPQGLGRLLAGGQLADPTYLYCSLDSLITLTSTITGLGNSNDNWLFKYPLQTSYILRPAGKTAPIEQESALILPFDSNPPGKALIAEISGLHPGGVHVARINGSVSFVRNVPIYARRFSAFGLTRSPIKWVRQPSYIFDFRLSPWIWLALDNPSEAQRIIKEHPPLIPLDDDTDDEEDGSDETGDDQDQGNEDDNDGHQDTGDDA
ncbi:MAG TPA: hypothetical protein EYP19_04935, partial [Desulfobacterales bacterium]|nr:hypothetical protein [Desulfobacterales bacterium]